MARFHVYGPFAVPFYKGKGSRTVTPDDAKEFWKKHPEFASRRGCYVFGIRAGKGMRPGYVGMATRSFKGEVFQPHKLTRYQQFFADYDGATPIMFFLAVPRLKGAPKRSQIRDLERFLIEVGVAANSGLLNKRGTKSADWGIVGVLRGGTGRPSKAAQSFRKLMGISATAL